MNPGDQQEPALADAKSREHHLVEVVDQMGKVVGVQTVGEAHQPPGRLHRAFSVILTDDSGRILLQRRSPRKTRFASRWANACCGHPAPGKAVAAAAYARLGEEIGLGTVALREAGIYVYCATDPLSNRVEFEYDHVLIGKVSADNALQPDPDEVADLRWVDRRRLEASLDADPKSYVPWLYGVITRLDATS